jgi:RNA polymerase sigma factor for flagellar operon FliA
MDAIDAFDLGRGVKFETYCAPRIRGAMLDELRAMDWVPRLARSRANRLEAATRSLQVELGRAPTSGELATRMGLNPADFAKLHKDAQTVSVISLSRKYYETDSNRNVYEIDLLQDSDGVDPELEVQQRDLKDLIGRKLTRTEQLILILYYYEQMTMKEIGGTLDLSESRVSQMHSAIIGRLSSAVQEPKDGLVPVE